MSKNIEARLAKIEKQVKDIQGKYDQEQWAIDVVLGLKATVLEEEPTERQQKALDEWIEKKNKKSPGSREPNGKNTTI